MPANIPLRTSIRVSEAAMRPGPSMLGTVLTIWSAVTALIVAATIAILWDLQH